MHRADKAHRSVGNLISMILLVVAFLVLVFITVLVIVSTGERFVFGYTPAVVADTSLEPEYQTNSIVLIKEAAYETLEAGDVAAFRSEQSDGAAVVRQIDGEAVNGQSTAGNLIGRVVWKTNALVGYVSRLTEQYGMVKYLLLPLAGFVLFVFGTANYISVRKSNIREQI